MSTARLDPHTQVLALFQRWSLVTGADASKELPLDNRNKEHNPIIDAEYLLALLYPLSEMPGMGVRFVKEKDGSVSYFPREAAGKLTALAEEKASQIEVLERIVGLCAHFFDTYQSSSGEPQFGARGYIETGNGSEHTVVPEESLFTTEAASFSLTLCLTVMQMARRLLDYHPESESLRKTLNEISTLASKRLTVSLQGLIAAYAVSTRTSSDWNKRTRRTWKDHIRELQDVERRLKALGAELSGGDKAFECGWSWAPLEPKKILRGRTDVSGNDDRAFDAARSLSSKVPVHGEAEPYFYFTVSAIDAIADLPKAVQAELLTGEQVTLANRLINLCSIAIDYWTVLGFGGGDSNRWPVLDVPWSPADTDPAKPEANSSEYWNLYLLRLAADRIPVDPRSMEQTIGLLRLLGDAARITRAPFPPRDDEKIRTFHWPGRLLTLLGYRNKGATTEHTGDKENLQFQWAIYDFAPQLLKVTAQMLARCTDKEQRDQLVRLCEEIWTHLAHRADLEGTSWDNLAGAFPDFHHKGNPPEAGTSRMVGSWYMTERVAEALVAMAKAMEVRPAPDPQLKAFCLSLATTLNFEIQQVLSSEVISSKQASQISLLLERTQTARQMVDDSPGAAHGLLVNVSIEFATKVYSSSEGTS
jgi:hypothetical protein